MEGSRYVWNVLSIIWNVLSIIWNVLSIEYVLYYWRGRVLLRIQVYQEVLSIERVLYRICSLSLLTEGLEQSPLGCKVLKKYSLSCRFLMKYTRALTFENLFACATHGA
jgi:hypothetical protein